MRLTCRCTSSWRTSCAGRSRGELAPRRPVPSKRTLMQTYGIAGGTIDKAMDLLRAEGLIKTVKGRGIYVTAPEER